MNATVLCIITFSLSVLLIVAAVIIGVFLHRAELKKTKANGRRFISPFRLFVICFFLAATLVLYPIYHVDYLVNDAGFVKVLKAILLSAQNALQMFTLNGGFDNINAFFSSGAVSRTLATVYTVYATFILIGAPMLTAGFVLSFFKDATARLLYTLRPGKEIYAFSKLNARSIALAEDILSGGKRGKIVVFTDVFEQNEEQDFELVLQAKRLGALCFRKDITELGLRYARKNSLRKLYLIGENEDENIRQALTLIDRHRGTKYDTPLMQFYVFSNNIESEALLNSTDNGEMKVRRINENRSLALHELRTHPIFDSAIEDGGKKKLNIVILGLGGYGTELLKAICWCGQMPDYTLEIHAFDKEDGEEKIRLHAPDLIKHNNSKKDHEAQYHIKFHNGTDVKSTHFFEELSKIQGITGVYVSLGDDELNIETAMHVRTALGRVYAPSDSDLPPIYAIVYSAAKTDTVARGNGLKNMNDEEYGITFIGALRDRYAVDSIEQPDLEKVALDIHLFWASTEEEKEKAVKKFNHYEYYRRSSMAQAVYRELRARLGYQKADEATAEGKKNNDILRDYEHRRWNTYMRTEGYILSDSKDHIAKTHTMLVPFDELPEEEKLKDDF